MDNSELIYSRLMEEAAKFTYPDKRIGTLERLKAACDAIASGEPIPASPGEPFSHRKAIQKINPSNIERVVKSKNWTGPKRSFIANKTNGVLEYVHAREEERVNKSGTASKTLPTQLESLLSEIHSIEVRQAMRNEIERRRTAEQEVKIIKEALKKLPQIDVGAFLGGRVTSDNMDRATQTSLSAPSEELQRQLRSLVERLTRGDLRRMGMKNDGGDILSINNAPVVLNSELKAMIELAGLPSSFLTQE
ncbi:hypothetical protein [uncultured Sulfitobacter sp.]|uniref:hypothetical protein n=1 Tax=uncultured Sulfitobacter sp. TaxID=191468 RepID=UPI0030D9B6A8